MPKNALKTDKPNDIIDKAFVSLKTENPNLNVNQIAEKLKASKIIRSNATLYKRYNNSDYLRREFSEVEKQQIEQLHREEYPLARKRVRKALKNKDLDDKSAFPYVKLVYDKVYGEKTRNNSEPGIQIGAIQNAQFIIESDLKSTDDNSNSDGQD